MLQHVPCYSMQHVNMLHHSELTLTLTQFTIASVHIAKRSNQAADLHPLTPTSDRAKEITRRISVFMERDMAAFSVFTGKPKVVQGLKEEDSTSITTDGWTSRAMQLHHITAHVIVTDWEMVCLVLQTKHSGASMLTLGKRLTEWELIMSSQTM